MDGQFSGHYDEWNRKRIAFIEHRCGRSWFPRKRILELGCGHAHIGRHFARLGAAVVCVDARPEHLEVVRREESTIATECADLNCQWPVSGRFDLILHLGVLYHLQNFRFSLERCFEHSDLIILETEVVDSLAEVNVSVDENRALYDQSVTGTGSRPSAAYLERLFDEHGFYAFRLANDSCNTHGEQLSHVYDWPCRDSRAWEHGKRRLWVLQRKSTLPPPTPPHISVVVQGPIIGLDHPKPRKRVTQQCIASVRAHLRDAEVIVSTWRGACTRGLDYDVLVESEDPGAVCCDDHYQIDNNVNRQIISSRAGVERGNRPYCLKIRSDVVLNSARFLHYWGRFPHRQWGYRFTAERMLNCSIYSRQFVGDKASGRITHMPFHPGDFLFFGFAEDLTNLFDISLAAEPESSRWFDIHGRPAGVFDWFAHAHCRFFPEQHIWISFLRKFLDIPLRDRLDLDHACLIHDLPGQVNNLVVLDQAQWSFQMPKYTLRQYTMPHYEWDGLLRHQVWRQRYGELSAGQPHRGLTYDSRMRLIFHDSRVARRIQQRAPRAFSYIQKRLRKQQLFP